MTRPPPRLQVVVPEESPITALRHDIEAWRDELRAELRAIRESLPRRAPSADAKLAVLLDQIEVGVEFTSRRLLKAAEDRKNEGFRKAIISIAGENPKTASRRLGKFLKECVGRVSGKKQLERVRRAGDGELYRVFEVVRSTTSATLDRLGHHGGERRSAP